MLLIVALSGAVCAESAGYRIYTVAGQRLMVSDLADQAGRYGVILFGEYHDNALLHQLERELLLALFAVKPELTLSLEMFERDVQPQLDAYLTGTISERDFLAVARPWQNYQQDYRPLVEFAKAQALPVLAANIPRTLAAQLAQTGSLTGIAPEQAVYLPQVHSAPPGEYRDRFLAQMRGMGGMRISPEKLESYYQAQCLKDDTMAESIAVHLQSHSGRSVIHYQGDFHSRRRLGVAEKLRRLDPALKIVVLAPVYVKDFDTADDILRQYRNDGDILVLIKEQ